MHNRADFTAELAQLARADLPVQEFYRALLPRLTAQLDALGSAVWICTEESIQLSGQHARSGPLIGSEAEAARHRPLLRQVREAGKPAFVLPRSASPSSASGNPTDLLLGICPVKVDETVVALLQSFHPGDLPAEQRDAGLQLLRDAAAAAGRMQRQVEMRQLRDRETWWGKFEAFTEATHASLDPTRTAYAIANEGRLVIGCDRLSVATRRGNKTRVAAVSGQDSVDKRAEVVVLLRKLVERVLAVGEPLVYPQPDAELPPQLEEAVDAYVDQSHVRFLNVLPLFEREADEEEESHERPKPPEVLGALVAEQFKGDPLSTGLVEAVGRQASSALGNAYEHHRIFLLPLWKAIGSLSWLVKARNLPKVGAAALLLLGVTLLLIFCPARFELSAEGTLQPERQRFVFAEVDGVVDQLEVQHGSRVERGAVLARLRSSETELALAEIEGELDTTIKKLAATKAARVADSTRPGADRARLSQLAAEEEELRQWLVSLREQQRLLQDRKKSLVVRSSIDGEVITWDLENLLRARPVSKGEVLMTVAQTDGPWVVELLLPDQRVGHLREAQRDEGDDLPVTFILATDPGRELQGKIKRAARTTVVDEQHLLSLPITVEIDEEQITQLRPGAKVQAKIACGERSLGYVWLHEVFEFFQSRVLFRF